MKDYVDATSDNGGVHINSGVPNRAFNLTATELGGDAWERAGMIWYVALRDRLSENSSFQDAAELTHNVAGNLFGKDSSEQKAVANGWKKGCWNKDNLSERSSQKTTIVILVLLLGPIIPYRRIFF
jgi:Zn-dependent metalloprotease